MIGKTISHYKILEKLGGGGMGVVYKARDTKLDRFVALKFLPTHLSQDEENKQRFIHEPKAASGLDHPNICTIYEVNETQDGQLFISMAYYEGETLKEKIESGRLSIDDAIDIGSQIGQGLARAHEAGIIHRDIKPANIMITSRNEVKIVDFGLAKLTGRTVLTKTGTTMGTVAYMSPEQARGGEIDQRTDIWSFGVVLYEMLTGRLPFQGEYEQAVIYSILNEEPEPMTNVAPEVEQVVKKALTKNPDDRYQTVDELINNLQAIEDKQSGRIKTMVKPGKLPYLIAAAIVVLIAIAFYLFRPTSKPVSEQDNVKTIAVLPFADMSPKKDQEYFSDGLAEQLLNELAKNPKLRVISRTSAFSFKGKNVDIPTIAEKLNVEHILEGSVRKAGNQIRITAQLIDVATDAHVWSETYDEKLENIFAVQDTISSSVAKALHVTLLGEKTQAAQAETSPAAYNTYLQGEHFRKLENFEKAIDYYEQALRFDPGYARARLGLSLVHSDKADKGYVPLDEGYSKARQEARKALSLDPNPAAAYAQIGWIKHIYDWDWTGANAAYQRALELEPGDAIVIARKGWLAATLGRFEEALALSRRAVKLNPVRAYARLHLGISAFYAGNLEEAEAAFRKALELNPQYPGAHMLIGRVYLEKGRPDSALAEMERETEPVWQKFGLALAYHALGKKKEADSTLAALIREYKNGYAFQIAEVYAYRGEADQAFEWLDRAYQQRDGGLAQIKGDPLLRSIEKDPRYPAFLKKMKLPV